MKKFYLGMPINNGKVGSRDGIGLSRAKQIRDGLERLTGDKCISRWIDHPFQNLDPFLRTVAVTCRGTHVEMGLSLAWGKPTYIYIAPGRDPMAFDQLCLPVPADWQAVIEQALELVK